MNLRKLVLLVVAFTYLQSAVGQRDLAVLNVFYNYINITTPKNTTEIFFLCRNSVKKRVVGNPYLDRKWSDALLISNEGNTYQVEGRYRVFDDEFQILLNNSVKSVFPHLVHGVILGEKAYMPAKIETPSGIDYAFFEVLAEGDVYLLKRFKTDVKTTKDNYVKIGDVKTQYYYMKRGDIARPLKQNRKNVSRVFGEKSNKLKAYYKAKQPNVRADDDLKKLFDYCNAL